MLYYSHLCVNFLCFENFPFRYSYSLTTLFLLFRAYSLKYHAHFLRYFILQHSILFIAYSPSLERVASTQPL